MRVHIYIYVFVVGQFRVGCLSTQSPVDNLVVCQHASYSVTFPFGRKENRIDWPAGCYLFMGKVYFNENQDGSFSNRNVTTVGSNLTRPEPISICTALSKYNAL